MQSLYGLVERRHTGRRAGSGRCQGSASGNIIAVQPHGQHESGRPRRPGASADAPGHRQDREADSQAPSPHGVLMPESRPLGQQAA
jgi:hypothetical protein